MKWLILIDYVLKLERKAPKVKATSQIFSKTLCVWDYLAIFFYMFLLIKIVARVFLLTISLIIPRLFPNNDTGEEEFWTNTNKVEWEQDYQSEDWHLYKSSVSVPRGPERIKRLFISFLICLFHHSESRCRPWRRGPKVDPETWTQRDSHDRLWVSDGEYDHVESKSRHSDGSRSEVAG